MMSSLMWSGCLMVFGDQDMKQRIVVNVGLELKEIISESRYFEQLGFSVPEQVRVVAVLQDKFLR